MQKFERRRVKKRTSLLVTLAVLWLGAVVFRLVQLQVIEAAQSRTIVLEQNQNISEIKPKRGTIYDRKGTILAQMN